MRLAIAKVILTTIFILAIVGASLNILDSRAAHAQQQNFNQSFLPTITNYNGQTTAGQGIPPIVSYAATTPTTPVGATNILASAPAGVYRVCYYSVVTTTGTVGTSFSLNLIYTDAQQAQTLAQFTNSTFTQGNVNQGCAVVQNQAAGNIQYSVTEAGSFTVHPVLALKMEMERLQ